MQKLTYINSRKQEAHFHFGEPYLFWQIDGTGLPPVDTIYSQSSGQSGYTLHGLLFDNRTVKLTGHVIGQHGSIADLYAKRKELLKICAPSNGPGTLIYENDHGKWRISAFCKSAPYTTKVGHVQTLTLEFECPSPFWQSIEPSVHGLAYVEGGLEFPVVLPGFFGTLGYRAVIDNDGDVPAPMELYIDGGAMNPTIKNITTGEFICVEREMDAAQQLYINTDSNQLAVELITNHGTEKTRENAYGYLSLDSSLFTLIPGENIILYESEDQNKKARVYIYFSKLYIGV